MATAAVPFPAELPPSYQWLSDEPRFDPKRHLALEKPAHTFTLSEFGYTDEEIAGTASPIAVSSPFRVLSTEGAEVLLHVARQLRAHAVSCERIDNMVRSGCYRSRFLRDLCLEPSITEMLCEIYQTDVAPHTMPVHLGHINFAPDDLSKAVDKWHHDTLPLDYVMAVTDPASLDGGEFEYFVGTKTEMNQLASQGQTPPRDRVRAPEFNGPGYAIALHGNMVVHRGAPLRKAAERITMVNGYVAMDTSGADQHRHKDLTAVDDPQVLYAEWARHAAWRARSRLDDLLENLEFSDDRLQVAQQLNEAIADARQAVDELSDLSDHEIHHYEKPAS